MTTTISFNPFVPGAMDDPYPAYAHLREYDPVHLDEPTGLRFLARYADVAELSRDPRVIRGRSVDGTFAPYEGTAIYRMLHGTLFGADDPHHRRLKGLITKAFARRPVESMIPRIEEICAGLLDEAGVGHGATEFELVTAFGYPLPFQVICELLGVPADDRAEFLRWTRLLTPITDPFPTDDVVRAGLEGCAAFEGYLTATLGERRRALRRGGAVPAGLITDLVRVSEEDRLGHDDLIRMAVVLLIAGFENVTNLISNTLRALCENPAQLRELRANPELFENLTDEALRYYSTTQFNLRETTAPIERAGVSIPAGATLVLLRGSANRDTFELSRPDSAEHVGFGEGVTICTGARLARIEVRAAFQAILPRAKELAITGWEQGPTKLFWGPRSVIVTC